MGCKFVNWVEPAQIERPVAGSCEHGNNLSGTIKYAKFVKRRFEYQLLKTQVHCFVVLRRFCGCDLCSVWCIVVLSVWPCLCSIRHNRQDVYSILNWNLRSKRAWIFNKFRRGALVSEINMLPLCVTFMKFLQRICKDLRICGSSYHYRILELCGFRLRGLASLSWSVESGVAYLNPIRVWCIFLLFCRVYCVLYRLADLPSMGSC
jgi:hypothetical protein